MKRIAVIGSGISGLSAAYYLSRRHEVHVFERDNRLGGHTNTVMVESSRGRIPVDTGFIVHNDRTYPNFCRLMDELSVETQPSDMSFAVAEQGGEFEYSSRGLSGFFAQKSNYLSPTHYTLLREILRFNREAPKVLTDPDAEGMTLGEFLNAGGYSPIFVDRYLIPMAGAVWSMAPEVMPMFPLLTLVRFMQNHGMLGVNTHPQWKVIRGGSHSYLAPLTASFRERITKDTAITSVERSDVGVTLQFRDRPAQQFDEVVFACHGDQILPLLAQPTEEERKVLNCFTTTRNETCLHTDSTLLPKRAAARASWNYLLGDAGKVTVTYHMNRLQSLKTAEDYCVTLNANGAVDPGRALRRMVYEHPLYTRAAIRAQERWPEISGKNRTHFCGAYWFYGFHEDGVRSGMRVAEALGVSCS
ncbi:MAG: FAD-dependent oxidoreductase [Bryobacteraceae bacterium]